MGPKDRQNDFRSEDRGGHETLGLDGQCAECIQKASGESETAGGVRQSGEALDGEGVVLQESKMDASNKSGETGSSSRKFQGGGDVGKGVFQETRARGFGKAGNGHMEHRLPRS